METVQRYTEKIETFITNIKQIHMSEKQKYI